VGLGRNVQLRSAGLNKTSPPWRAMSETEALGYLTMSGIAPDVARRINLIARGHPLALGMATSIALTDRRPLAAFEDFSGGSLWLAADDRGFHHQLSIRVDRQSHAPDVLRCFGEVDPNHQRIA
jgi:hypothetical protein